MIDLETGLDKILTKSHFWMTLIAFSVLVSTLIMLDVLLNTGNFQITIQVLIFGISALFFYGYFLRIKRKYERVASKVSDDEQLNSIGEIIELMEQKKIDQVSKGFLETVQEQPEDLSWRDLWP